MAQKILIKRYASSATLPSLEVGEIAVNLANKQLFIGADPTPIMFMDSSAITAANIGAISSSLLGAHNGVAQLDSNGKVPSNQLPSYVDDVVEVANFAALPVTGEAGKIYVTKNTNITYRWSGSAYVEISASLALGETHQTAFYGDLGKIAHDHASIENGNPHGLTLSTFGIDSSATEINALHGLSDKLGYLTDVTGNIQAQINNKVTSGTAATLASLGLNNGGLEIEGSSGTPTPYIDLVSRYHATGQDFDYTSRIIETAEGTALAPIAQGKGALQIISGSITLNGNVIVPQNKYLQIGKAKFEYILEAGGTPAHLRLVHADGGDNQMHFTTTGGMTMFGEGISSAGTGGGASVILNGIETDDAKFYAPVVPGSGGQILISQGLNAAPIWTTLSIDFDDLESHPTTIAEYGITDAASKTALTNLSSTVNDIGTKTNLLFDNIMLFNASRLHDSYDTLEEAAGAIPADLYNKAKRGMLLSFEHEGGYQELYEWVAVADMNSTNITNPGNWKSLTFPDIDGGLIS